MGLDLVKRVRCVDVPSFSALPLFSRVECSLLLRDRVVEFECLLREGQQQQQQRRIVLKQHEHKNKEHKVVRIVVRRAAMCKGK